MTPIDINSPIPTEAGVCRSCGSTLAGPYCSNCGEKEFVPGEHSVRHFFGDVLNAITFLDTKFLRTIKLMFRKPGAMSYQYINGRRVPFIKPMSMFFIVNLIYFLFTWSDGLNSQLYSQMHNMPHSPLVTRMVEKRVKEEKTDLKTFTIAYENQSTNMAKMWLVLLVLYFSIPLWLVNYKKKLFYFDHLTVALELMSIAAIYMYILVAWLAFLIIWIAGLFGTNASVLMSDAYQSVPSLIILLILLYAFERNTYQQSIFRSISKAALLVFAFYVVLTVYRASLFFITMWTL